MIIDTAHDTTKVLLNLKKAGVTSIIRYYSKSMWKRLTPAEAHAIAGAGMTVGVVYEYAGDRPETFSTSSGTQDAHTAMQQADACGQPLGSAIYFAVDFDPTPQQITSHIAPYFAAVRDAIAGKYRIGAYASGAVCRTLKPAEILSWVTCSLGFMGTRSFLAEGGQDLYQGTFDGHGNPTSGCDKILYGLSVDYNTAHVEDWGQFVPFQGQMPTPIVHGIPWMQSILGVIPDGKIGPLTIEAMIKYIESHEGDSNATGL